MKPDTEIAKEFFEKKSYYDSIRKKKNYASRKLAKYERKRDEINNSSIKEGGGGIKKAVDDRLVEIIDKIDELKKEIDHCETILIEWDSAVEEAKEENPSGGKMYELYVEQKFKQTHVSDEVSWSVRKVGADLTDFTEEIMGFLKDKPN